MGCLPNQPPSACSRFLEIPREPDASALWLIRWFVQSKWHWPLGPRLGRYSCVLRGRVRKSAAAVLGCGRIRRLCRVRGTVRHDGHGAAAEAWPCRQRALAHATRLRRSRIRKVPACNWLTATASSDDHGVLIIADMAAHGCDLYRFLCDRAGKNSW